MTSESQQNDRAEDEIRASVKSVDMRSFKLPDFGVRSGTIPGNLADDVAVRVELGRLTCPATRC